MESTMREGLLDLRDAVGWSDRLDASLIAGLDVIARVISPAITTIFMLKDDPNTLVRVADEATCQLLGEHFETMPAEEHVHPPWLNRELTPVCAADHLDHPAWEQMDIAFRDWFGTNGIIAPIVGERRHFGAVLLAFDDPTRRLTPEETDFLTLAGRILGDAVMRIRVSHAIRRNTVVDERQRIMADYGAGILENIGEMTGVLTGLTAADLDASARDTLATVRDQLTQIEDAVAAEVAAFESSARSTADPFTQLLARELEAFESKWEIPVSLIVSDTYAIDVLPISAQAALNEAIQSALSDVREHVSTTEAAITLDGDGSHVAVRIVDNGVASAARTAASGQRVLRERVEDLGGSVSVRALPSRGTKVEITIPITSSPPPTGSTSVLLADPDALFREGVAALLRQWDEFRVVGRVTDSHSTLTEVNRLAPDLLLIDATMRGGLAAIRSTRMRTPATKVVALASSASDAEIAAVMQTGASGYLLKGSSPYELRDNLNAAVAGHVALSPEIAARAQASLESAVESRLRASADLTERERDVLSLLAQGHSNEDIASALYLSVSTVKKRLNQIMAKLHLDNRVQLAVYAVRSGIVA